MSLLRAPQLRNQGRLSSGMLRRVAGCFTTFRKKVIAFIFEGIIHPATLRRILEKRERLGSRVCSLQSAWKQTASPIDPKSLHSKTHLPSIQYYQFTNSVERSSYIHGTRTHAHTHTQYAVFVAITE